MAIPVIFSMWEKIMSMDLKTLTSSINPIKIPAVCIFLFVAEQSPSNLQEPLLTPLID